MRTFVANCMMIALTIALVEAPCVLNPVLAQRPRAGSIAASTPERSFIQGVQFEEVVPGPAAEVDIATEISNAIGEVVSDSGSAMPEMMPAAMAPVEAVPMMESAPMGVPAVESAISGEIVYDTAFEGGQPYDIPVSDVIPQDSAEVYSTNNWFRGGQWYSKQELVMLLRSDLSPTHLAVDNTSVAGALLSGAAAVVLDPFLSHSLNSEDGGVTYEAGTRLSLGKIMGRDVANRDHSIEFTFFGLFDHTGRASIEPTNLGVAAGIDTLLGSREVGATTSQTGQVSGFPFIHRIAGFSDSARQEMLFTSSLNSFEMNYMVGGRPARDRLVMQPDGRWSRFATPSKIRGFYFGLRYVRQNEMFRYQGFGNRQAVSEFAEDELGEIVFQDGDGNPDTDDPVPTVTGTRVGTIDERGTYRVNTDNDLFGFQIGGDVVAKRTDWAFGLNGKVGGLINFADRNSSLFQRTEVVADRPVTNNPEDDAVFETSSAVETLDDETLTFLTELNIYMAYYLRPNTSVKVGYNVLYMNGMAAALDNSGLQGGIFPKFELTGDAFYHGMNVGFETSW